MHVADEPKIVWSFFLRLGASAAIAWHLVGVMVAPISTPPRFEGQTSVVGAKLKEVYEPYITALYLDHAYKFFAPNPGDSHLLRYDLHYADGTKRVDQDDLLLPDRHRHWPRLLYHRHFMLTEFINDFAPPWVWRSETLPAVADGAGQGGEAIPSPGEFQPPPHIQTYLRGIADYLVRKHDAKRVELYYRKHLLPSIDDFRQVGGRLDSNESYLDRLMLRYPEEPRS